MKSSPWMNCIMGLKPIMVTTGRWRRYSEIIEWTVGPSTFTGRSTLVRTSGCRQRNALASVSTSTRSRISG